MYGHLRPLVLTILNRDGGMSGAELTDAIEETTGQAPSPGTIYPLLEDLEAKELVSGEEEGRERVYTLTDRGVDMIEEFQHEKEDLLEQSIQNLRGWQEIFGEEEIEALITRLEQLKGRDPDDMPPTASLMREIQTMLLHNADIDEPARQEIITILEDARDEIREVIDDEQ